MMFKQFNKKLFSTLVLAEHNGKSLSKNTLKILTAAKQLQEKQTHLLLLGKQLSHVVDSIHSLCGQSYISKVYTAALDNTLSESVQKVVSDMISKNGYNYVVGLSSSYGKDVIPRLASKFDSQPISDIIEVHDPKTFSRPTYAGNAVTKVRTSQQINFLTFRASSFSEPETSKNQVPVQQVNISGATDIRNSFVSQEKSDSNKPDLTTARIVVSGGRGVKSKQNFAIIEKLAEAFGDAAVGASRAAVDAGFCPNELQVGQTGKVVAPQLYIAVGISGAVQHLAGMKDSKVIVAINNRPQQPIFEYANYGLQGDLFKILPQLSQKIKKARSD